MEDNIELNRSRSRSKMLAEDSAFELRTVDITSQFSKEEKLPNKQNPYGIEVGNRLDEINKKHVAKIEAKLQLLKDEDDDIKKSSDIDSEDIRYRIACNNSVTLIRTMESNTLKPGYEQYKITLDIIDKIKLILIILIFGIIIFAKPDWCEFRPFISRDCKYSTKPGEQVLYPRSGVPILFENAEKKIMILLLSIIVIAINLFKIAICKSSARDRNSFAFCLIVVIIQIIVYFFNSFNIYKIELFDILTVFTIIFGVPALQETLFKFINVIFASKEIIIMLTLYILMFALCTQVFFHSIKDFNDSDGNAYFKFDFSGFTRAFYSVSITILTSDNVYEILSYLTSHLPIGLIFFIPFILISAFFLVNFMMGIMYFYYTELFVSDVTYIEENYNNLSLGIKKHIAQETLTSSVLKQNVEINFLKGNLDVNMYEIDKFYKNTGNIQNYYDDYESNPHNFKNIMMQFTNTLAYTVVMGILDAIKVILIVFCIEANSRNVITLQLLIISINFILALDAFNQFIIAGFRLKLMEVFNLFNLIFVCISFSYLCINASLSNPMYWAEFFANNQHYIRYFCLFTVLTSYRCLSLLSYNEQIKTVTEVVFTSLPLMADIISIIFLTIFMYAAIGMIFFGGVLDTRQFGTTDVDLKKIAQESDLYLNFNDMVSSMISLLIIMFKGWTDIAQNNTTGDNEHFLEYFFYISFFIVSKLCFLNIIAGFLINNCSLYLNEKMMEIEKKKKKKIRQSKNSLSEMGIRVEQADGVNPNVSIMGGVEIENIEESNKKSESKENIKEDE